MAIMLPFTLVAKGPISALTTGLHGTVRARGTQGRSMLQIPALLSSLGDVSCPHPSLPTTRMATAHPSEDQPVAKLHLLRSLQRPWTGFS